jgi:hypothetical protein
LAEVWTDIVKRTALAGSGHVRVGETYGRIVNAGPHLQKALPKQIPLKRRKDIAIAAALASAEVERTLQVPVVNLGRTYRAAEMFSEAVSVFRDNVATINTKEDYREKARGFWYEWAVCEGQTDPAADAWLTGLSLSDFLRPAPLWTEDIKLALAGIGDCFGRLAQGNPENPFARGLRASAHLGKLLHKKLPVPDLRNYDNFDRHEKSADALGVSCPANTREALRWMEEGVRAAWRVLSDQFLRDQAVPTRLTFQTLGDHFRTY